MHAWIPVFFLYFSSQVSLSEVITLSAVYYFAVCILEVPCGLFSDHLGRRLTLICAAISAIAAFSVFLIGGNFAVLSLGQILLATSIALQSGTDVALHYDSLKTVNQQSRYLALEARAEKFGLLATALATLCGGALAMFDLRLAYALSLAGALWTLYLTNQFMEPPQSSAVSGSSILQPLKQTVHYLQHPLLIWIFGVMILMYCLEHLTFEFYQPYIRLLMEQNNAGFSANLSSAPLVSGVIVSVSMFGGALGAMSSVRLLKRTGLIKLLVYALLLQFLILSSMSPALIFVLVLPVMLRNFPMSLIHAPVNAAIAPLVNSADRATFLSVQSLASRLAMSSTLLVLSYGIDQQQPLDWSTLQGILLKGVLFGVAGIALALIVVWSIRRHPSVRQSLDSNTT